LPTFCFVSSRQQPIGASNYDFGAIVVVACSFGEVITAVR
jgi:hypothetical protein